MPTRGLTGFLKFEDKEDRSKNLRGDAIFWAVISESMYGGEKLFGFIFIDTLYGVGEKFHRYSTVLSGISTHTVVVMNHCQWCFIFIITKIAHQHTFFFNRFSTANYLNSVRSIGANRNNR